jgi:type II secretory pathway component GspD/PulD (secretin)
MKTPAFLIACVWLTLALAAPIPEFRTYDIGFADASNTVEVVSAMLGADGRVFFDPSTRRLMVLASSNGHHQVVAVIRQVDVPPRNVRIEVRYRGQERNTEREASVSGSGAVVLGNGPTRSAFQVRPRLTDTASTLTSSTAQQILVSSGRQASIFVGETVPYLEWIMDYGVRCGIVAQQVTWQQVGATLVVEPFVIGDGPMIRVRLTPELSGRVNGDPYRTRFTTVAIEVVVSDGVPFSLGGLNQNKDFYSRFLVGVNQSGTRQSLDIELTARIVPSAGP